MRSGLAIAAGLLCFALLGAGAAIALPAPQRQIASPGSAERAKEARPVDSGSALASLFDKLAGTSDEEKFRTDMGREESALMSGGVLPSVDPEAPSGQPPALTEPPPTEPAPPSEPPVTAPLPPSVLAQGSITEGVIPREDPSQVEVLGPHDLLEISVFDLDPFNRTVRIADDGSITLPFLGRIDVQGLTRVALEQRIASMLGDKYVNDPQVSVFVKEYESRKISVSGAVRTPATFEMMGGKTLLDVVSAAGGFTEDVGRSVFVIRRRHDGTTERIQVDLERLIYAGEQELNVPIQPGDVIYAPIEEKITIYVNGAVKTPGGYDFKHGDQITVLRAITKAGGTTERAAERRVQILRRHSDGNQSVIPVDLRKVRAGKISDPVLQREDVVDVPEAFF